MQAMLLMTAMAVAASGAPLYSSSSGGPGELAAYAAAAGARAAAAPTQVCEVGTVCTAAYSGSGQGCCPYEGAVCCPNKQTCCPGGSTCNDTGTYLTQVRPPRAAQPGLNEFWI